MDLFTKRRSRNGRFQGLRRNGGGEEKIADSPSSRGRRTIQSEPQHRQHRYQPVASSTTTEVADWGSDRTTSTSSAIAMELTPLLFKADTSSLQIPRPQGMGAASESSGTTSVSGRGTDRRRDDRRRGRLNTELLTAVLDGDLQEVTRRLDAGASVNATCRLTRTSALQLAVASGHVEISHMLLCRGASLSMRDRQGRQAIHLAAATGSLLLLQLLLDSEPRVLDSPVDPGASADSADNDYLDSWSHDHKAVEEKIPELTRGATALHLAVQRLHLDCVEELLHRGANVDFPDYRGLSPLDVTGEILAKPATDVLVDLADALPTSDETLTRIENMKQRISGNPSMRSMHMRVRLPSEPQDKRRTIRISSDDSDTNNRMFSSNPPSSPPVLLPNTFRLSDPTLVITPSKPSSKTIPSLAQKVASHLINKGAKMTKSSVIVKQDGGVDSQVRMQTSCLHMAVERQDLQLIEYLLGQGGCLLTWNSAGLTPLHLAVSQRLTESLRLLLELNKTGQVIDSRDIHGRTPLQVAVEEQWSEGVSLLLEAGADVKVSSNDSQTVLHAAAKVSNPQLLEELLTIPESLKIIDSRNSQHETPLSCAVSEGQLSCVLLLLARGADITTSLPGDITLLHVAAEQGDIAVLQALLRDSRLAPFKNVRTKEGKGGATALHLAALKGYDNCVKALLDSGCDVFSVTTISPYYGSTALHLAGIKGHFDVVKTIIKHNKSTLCIKNADGWYPLHVAARFANKECVCFMLLNGANLAATIIDSSGYRKTALDIIVYSVLHPITFLERIFDSCLEVNEYPLNNPKCVVKVSYDLLQPLGPQRKQLKVLSSLLNCGKHVVQEKLLLHPLVETFLYLKWKKLRVFFFMMMALYMVFTVSLTTLGMFFYVLKAESPFVDLCVTGCRITLCVSLSLITFQELLQASRMQRYYVKDLESWVKWSTFLLATIVVVCQHPTDWLLHVSAVAVLLSWLELLFLLSRWPSALGFYILMFFTVAKNVTRVLATFTFVILGFMFAFMIHFQAKDPFDNWWEALVKVMVMTLEFDYGSLYEGIDGVDATSIVGRSIFLSFMVLVAIVLMNLLVGLAVSDIAQLEKQGRAQRLAKQIDFLSLLEVFVYNRSLFSCCPKKLSEAIKRCRATEPSLIIEPGKPLRKTRSFLPQQLRQSVINNIIARGTREEDSSDEEVVDGQKKPEPDTSSSSSHSKSEKPVENKGSQMLVDAELKSKLEFIVSELGYIRGEIERMKEKNEPAQRFSQSSYGDGDQNSTLYRT